MYHWHSIPTSDPYLYLLKFSLIGISIRKRFTNRTGYWRKPSEVWWQSGKIWEALEIKKDYYSSYLNVTLLFNFRPLY